MSDPRVTVLLPVHQGARFLAEAIESIIEQSFDDLELLIVDDGSTDATPDVIAGFADPRIRCVRNEEHRGLVATLDQGLRLARGELVARMDADDVSLPDRIARQVAFMDAHPEVGACGTWAVTFGDVEGRPMEYPTGSEDVRCQLIFENALAHPTVCLRRAWFGKGELAYRESDLHAEDYGLWVRASERFPLANLGEVLLRYRMHAGSVSRRYAAKQRASVARIQRAALRPLGMEPLDPDAAPRDAERWLADLLRANRTHGVHPQAALERAVGRRWRKITRRANASGEADLGHLVASPLTRLVPVRERARLLGRTALVQLRSRPAASDPAVRIPLPDAMGGVASYVLDLAELPAVRQRGVRLLWLAARASEQTRVSHATAGSWEKLDHVWPDENLFAVLRRMHQRLGSSRGPIVASELFGLAYGARHGGGAPLVQILHGDIPMYYDLAARFEPWIDAFVAVSERVAEETVRRFPHRSGDVHHLPTGIPIPDLRQRAAGGPLRLVYAGRIDRKKGVLDLPGIDRRLRARGEEVAWTVIGAGPEDAELQQSFDAEATVDFAGSLDRAACRARLADHDVFVLPSHGEGLPLSLLEAMACGLVPVVSDLESGVREVVDDGATGLLARPGHPEEFATAILRLARQPDLLADCSRAAAARVRARHALPERGAAWLELLADLEARPPRSKPVFRRGPSRLDRPWLPNALVRSLRRLLP
ncbi:MAG: glycosyltransferase [Myxococcota bacterium]